MDKCDNISSLSFSNFPLKTSFAIKSFQKSLETHLRIITPLTSSIGTIIHGDLNGTIILYKKNLLGLLAMEDFEDRSWFILQIKDWKKSWQVHGKIYSFWPLALFNLCVYQKILNFIPFKRNWQVFFACASICFKHHYHWHKSSPYSRPLPLSRLPSNVFKM